MYPTSTIANVIVILLGAALGLLDARRLARRDPSASPEEILKLGYVWKKAPHLLLMVLGLALFGLFFLGVNWKISVRWSLPAWWQLRGQGSLWAAILGVTAMLGSLTVTLAFRGGHPKRRRILVALPLVTGALFFLVWNMNAPIAPRLYEKMGPKNVVILQSSGVSCVAASAANIVRRYGIEMTEREMAHALGTTRMGTTMAQLIYGLEPMGFECTTVERPDGAPMDLQPPAVLLVDHPRTPREGHAAAYMGTDGDKFEVWDPTLGKVFLSQDELNDIWHGHAVECRRTKSP